MAKSLFIHPALKGPLSRWNAFELRHQIDLWVLEQPWPEKPLSGKESPGGDPWVTREQKRQGLRP